MKKAAGAGFNPLVRLLTTIGTSARRDSRTTTRRRYASLFRYEVCPAACPRTSSLGFVQFIVDTVDQGLVGSIDNIVGNTHGAPTLGLVARLDQYADGRSGTLAGRQDTHLVIQQLDLLQFRVELLQRLADGVVESIDRPASLGRGVLDLAPTLTLMVASAIGLWLSPCFSSITLKPRIWK